MKVNHAERISRLLPIPVSHRLLVLVAAALLVAGFGLALSGVQEAHAARATIKSIKNDGSQSPLTPGPCPVTNGPFAINEDSSSVPVCGDGSDEITTWTFDFNPNSCGASGPVTSAVLILTLTPGNSLVSNDRVQIVGLPSIAVDAGGWANSPLPLGGPYPLMVGSTSTISRDLIAPGDYTSSQILGIFTANSGSIPMAYQDDATVSFAELDLTCELPPVGGVAALTVSSPDSRVPWTPLAAVAAGVMAVLGAGLWYGRRRWLR
jgi:hypothetical protein